MARTPCRRLDLSTEPGGVRGTGASYTNISAYEAVVIDPQQVDLPDAGELDSNMNPRRSKPGPKSCTLNFNTKLTEDTNAQYGALIGAALGETIAGSVLAANTGGTQTATQGAYSSGTPDGIVKVTYNSGEPDYLPVKTDSGSLLTYSIQSNKASRSVTAILNASQCGGNAYEQKEDDTYTSFCAEADRAGESGENTWLLQGMVPTMCKVLLPLQARAMLQIAMLGCDWQGPAYSIANLADMPDWDHEFNGWPVQVTVYDPSSAAADSSADFVAVENLDFAPVWTPKERGVGRTSSGTVPGSAVNGWNKGLHFPPEKPLILTLGTMDQTFWTKRTAGTVVGVFFRLFSGHPAASTTRVICIDFPACEVNSNPKEVPVGSQVGMQVPLLVRKATGLPSGRQTKCRVSFFNS